MHIQFVRSGGFAGARLALQVDTATLPPDEARALEELVEAAAFFSLPETLLPAIPQADRYQYTITIERGDIRHTVRTSEEMAPSELQPLLDSLTQLAIKRARG
jgi:hypothetical protein